MGDAKNMVLVSFLLRKLSSGKLKKYIRATTYIAWLASIKGVANIKSKGKEFGEYQVLSSVLYSEQFSKTNYKYGIDMFHCGKRCADRCAVPFRKALFSSSLLAVKDCRMPRVRGQPAAASVYGWSE